MKTFKTILFFGILSFVFAACNENGPSGGSGTVDGDAVYYVLNSGDWKSNNSSLTMFDAVTGSVSHDCFMQKNGRGLGNTANDILVYGSKMYIAVAGESTIEITDLDAKSLKQINCEAQPRYLAAAGGYVYATYYDGYVARIDTASLAVDGKVKVGRNPEGIAVYGNRLYVANSGGMDYNTEVGYDKTVSVVDLNSFTELKKIDVVVNPAIVVAVENGVFVASYGNYADVPGTLQFINARDEVSVPAGCSNMTEFCGLQGTLYGFFSQYDANWNATITYLSYNMASGDVDSPWIKEAELPVPYKVCAAGEYVCVTSSDFLNDGDVYLYDKDGMLVNKVAAGLNPVKVVKR